MIYMNEVSVKYGRRNLKGMIIPSGEVTLPFGIMFPFTIGFNS